MKSEKSEFDFYPKRLNQRQFKMSLAGRISLVTGASKGIGKGVACQLGQAGSTVYITGKSFSETFILRLVTHNMYDKT